VKKNVIKIALKTNLNMKKIENVQIVIKLINHIDAQIKENIRHMMIQAVLNVDLVKLEPMSMKLRAHVNPVLNNAKPVLLQKSVMIVIQIIAYGIINVPLKISNVQKVHSNKKTHMILVLNVCHALNVLKILGVMLPLRHVMINVRVQASYSTKPAQIHANLHLQISQLII